MRADPSLPQISKTLDQLCLELGEFEVLNFFELCIRELSQSSANLKQHIDNKDWERAKQIIHQLHGSSNLYASSRLKQLFAHIADGALAEESLHQMLREIETELVLVLDYMKKKLK